MKTPNNPTANTNTRIKAILQSKRAWIAFTLVSLAIIGGAIHTSTESYLQEIACSEISRTIAAEIEKGHAVTPELVNDTISSLIRTSLIYGQIDSEGNPTDRNGNAFEVVIDGGNVTTSTSRSLLHPFRSHATSIVDR